MYILRKGVYRDGLIDLIDYIGKTEIKSMIEIGSYAGESSELFVVGFNCRLHCIDAWQGGYDKTDFASNSDMSLVEFHFNKRMLPYNLVKMKMTSDEAVTYFQDGSQDLVYIDGDHQYKQVKKDILNYKTKIRKGGFLAGHDFSNKDVNKVLRELNIDVIIFKDDSWLTQL